MVSNGSVTAVSKRTRASVANTRYVVRVSTEDSCFDSTKVEQDISISTRVHRGRRREVKSLLGHVTAVLVSDDLPYDLVVLHLSRWSFEIRRRRDGIFGQERGFAN